MACARLAYGLTPCTLATHVSRRVVAGADGTVVEALRQDERLLQLLRGSQQQHGGGRAAKQRGVLPGIGQHSGSDASGDIADLARALLAAVA